MSFEPVDFWMVWTKTGWPPKRQHKTKIEAMNEAARLAHQHPGKKFMILKAETKVWVDAPEPTAGDAAGASVSA